MMNTTNMIRQRPNRSRAGCSCGCIPLVMILFLIMLVGLYFLAPGRTNILLLGIDFAPIGTVTGRSDSIVLTTFIPIEPYVGMLSLPRDLWVTVPGIGENRINTAHFFAEAQLPGSGPAATIRTIKANFGIDMPYFVRVRLDSVIALVDSMGGVDIILTESMAGYPAGRHHLNGRQALWFSRNRQGADDFARMQQGQILLKAVLSKMARPITWTHLPDIYRSYIQTVNTNVPMWLWPRLGVALLRVGPDGLDNRVLSRDMVTPYITDQGANVLLPKWDLILPLVEELFLP